MKITILVAVLIGVWSLAARCNSDAVVKDAQSVTSPDTMDQEPQNDGVTQDVVTALAGNKGAIKDTDVVKSDLELRVEEYLNVKLKKRRPLAFYKSLGLKAVPLFVEVLKDRERSAQWRNAVHALGWIGDPSAYRSLITFIETTDGRYSSKESIALFEVPWALGRLAARNNKDALDYLIAHLPVESWDHLRWRSDTDISDSAQNGIPDDMRQHLEGSTISGLALSGTPQAAIALQQELDRLKAENTSDLRTVARIQNIEGALLIHGEISAVGFDAYYSEKEGN